MSPNERGDLMHNNKKAQLFHISDFKIHHEVVDSLIEKDIPTPVFSPTSCSPTASRMWGVCHFVYPFSTKLSTPSGCREGINAVCTRVKVSSEIGNVNIRG